MTLSVSGDSITFPDLSTLQTAPSGFGFKNRIINGDMRISQANNGGSITATTTVSPAAAYPVDRFYGYSSPSSKFSIQRNAGSVTPPAGFTNYLGATSLSAYSVGAADVCVLDQRIEGFNIADFGWGAANAQPVTLSFWVRSSLTGSFGGSVKNNAGNRSYPYNYTISAANTWEQKTITIPGDTTGTWLTDSSIGIEVVWGVGVGSTNSGTAGAWAAANYASATGATSVVGTSGATFYITGVQLEKGSTATAFDYLDYGRSLIQCQRYAVVMGGESIYTSIAAFTPAIVSTVIAYMQVYLPVKMRSSPSVVSSGAFRVDDGYASSIAVTGIGINTESVSSLVAVLSVNTSGSLNVGRLYQLQTGNSLASRITFSSEL